MRFRILPKCYLSLKVFVFGYFDVCFIIKAKRKES